VTIDIYTAAQLDNLGLEIFNPHVDPLRGTIAGRDTALRGPDTTIDAKLLAAITEPMQVIDGRTPLSGFKYTLNVTNALQLRPKHWYLAGIMEYNTSNTGVSSLWPASTAMEYIPNQPYGVAGGTNSFGYTIGLATCACICHAWASIIRMWLFNNYPSAVTRYTGPQPDDAAINAAAATIN
jgi:hypothetical protein